jgi:two-component sensor histidine kinase
MAQRNSYTEHPARLVPPNLFPAKFPATRKARGSKRVRSAKAQTAPGGFPDPCRNIAELRQQLLDELNHRLKNNLQLIYGILHTAYRNTHNSEAREVLSDTSRRIGAMVAAQQIFYSVHNGTNVNGRRLVEAVCANARAFFGSGVSINYEAAPGCLPKEAAMPLALALNELLTNAAKHGADEHGVVAIDVGLSAGSGEIELFVQDCGCGFDLGEVRARSSGLGLVTRLAQRLKGRFTVERQRGARCTVKFPDQ